MSSNLVFLIQNYFSTHPFFLPIGIIGIWRWGVWAFKRTIALFYKPEKKGYKNTVSIITPVYNEDPAIFARALKSWGKNSPEEIIAVIDYTDKTCIRLFKKFAKNFPGAKLIITKTPGKRPALADGIRAARSTIVALVDSDTIWTKGVLKSALIPFRDSKIAGVATKQSVLNPDSLAQKLFSVRLEQRYWDDIPFLARTGSVQACLSGRTAFYRRDVVLPLLEDFLNETFMGKRVISGEDKRLTYLVEEARWKVAYQSSAHVFTPGASDLTTFLKQQIRWTRNAARADIGALRQRWVFRHPIFAIYLIDRIIQAFTLLLSPIYFTISLVYGFWIPALILLLWWHVSRGIKMFPHLRRKPLDIVILPVYIIFNFLSAYIRLYAFFTLNHQGWITRWDKSRLPRFSFLRLAPAYAATFLVIVGLITGTYFYKQYTYFIPLARYNSLLADRLPQVSHLALANSPSVLSAETFDPNALIARRYEVQNGDSIASISAKFNIDMENLLFSNIAKLTNWNKIEPGTILTIPPARLKLKPEQKFNYNRVYPDILQIFYDSPSDTIIASGRGKEISLSNIRDAVGEEFLEEMSPKIWYLKANLYLKSGVTLKLDKSEVAWLKMLSNRNKFVSLIAYNVTITINGVKITSWDENSHDFDQIYQDGRSYILVKDGSRLDILNSELAYLGYARTPDLKFSPYGVSWRMSNGKFGTTILTGEVINSNFHHNYFGTFTFGATGMVWRGNEFYNNVVYGLDPHDDSNGFLIEDNRFYNNGKHGLILSKRCINNLIRNNYSYNNQSHGIMLHEASNNNIIEGNTLFGNLNGIAFYNSSKNTIRDNNIYNNNRGFRANKNSKENLIENNKITNSSQYGIYLYDGADKNIIKDNTLTNNFNAIYIKSNNNQLSRNIVNNNRIGVYLLGQASNNRLFKNKITDNKWYGIYAKISEGLQNLLSQNYLERNREDTAAYKLY